MSVNKSINKSMNFLEKLISRKQNFNILFSEWITLLQSLACYQSKFAKILKQELERGASTIWTLKLDASDALNLFYSLKYVHCEDHIIKKYIKRYTYEIRKEKDIFEGTRSFDPDDFDSLWQEATKYLFMKLSKKKLKEKNRILNFKYPKDRFPLYWNALQKFDFRKLEKSVKDYHDLDYFATHVPFFYVCYGCCLNVSKRKKLLKSAKEYLIRHFDRIINGNDIDLKGETLEAFHILKVNRTYKKKLLKIICDAQKKNGNFDIISKSDTLYDKFHPSWACLGGLIAMY